MKKYAFLLSLIFALQTTSASARTIGTAYTIIETAVSPASYSDWAETYIRAAEDIGFLTKDMQNGYSDFITRRHFCEIAYNMLIKWGMDAATVSGKIFSDTDSKPVNALYSLGIVNGISETEFAPNDYITREEAATLLTRLAMLMGISIQSQNHKFEDDKSISDWAKESVYKMYSRGIMNGTSEKIFSPKARYTKEQAIATMVRLYELG